MTTHTIGYAYPTSQIATVLKQHRAGCWYFELGPLRIRCDDYADALRKAAAFKSQPDRWSTDHPLNAAFAPQ